ncbi:glycerate kinase [Actinomycetaceae bacterium MB13-C1-2]|nr:glycerate kinase [Actinomycetaceae bacterium MB13-C1-2]
MRVLVIGHWDLSAEDLSGKDDLSGQVLQWLANEPNIEGRPEANVRALQGIVEGIRASVDASVGASLQLRLLPFGPASAFVEALAQDGAISGNFRHIVSGRREASSVGIGSELRDLGDFKGTVLVEGGHSWSHDWGMGLLGALAGEPLLSLDDSSAKLEAAVESARSTLAGRTIVVASSTSRPLLGVGGTGYVAPDLSLRQNYSSGSEHEKAISRWAQVLKGASQRTVDALRAINLTPIESRIRTEIAGPGPVSPSPVAAAVDPTLLEGSGVAGGSGALLAALGVPIRSTWETLSTLSQLPKLVGEADLIVAVEPHLDSPNLVDSALRKVCALASLDAVPVVAVATQSSLSGPERADIGLHGVSLIRAGTRDPFVDVGRRIAQTWIR